MIRCEEWSCRPDLGQRPCSGFTGAAYSPARIIELGTEAMSANSGRGSSQRIRLRQPTSPAASADVFAAYDDPAAVNTRAIDADASTEYFGPIGCSAGIHPHSPTAYRRDDRGAAVGAGPEGAGQRTGTGRPLMTSGPGPLLLWLNRIQGHFSGDRSRSGNRPLPRLVPLDRAEARPGVTHQRVAGRRTYRPVGCPVTLPSA